MDNHAEKKKDAQNNEVCFGDMWGSVIYRTQSTVSSPGIWPTSRQKYTFSKSIIGGVPKTRKPG